MKSFKICLLLVIILIRLNNYDKSAGVNSSEVIYPPDVVQFHKNVLEYYVNGKTEFTVSLPQKEKAGKTIQLKLNKN